MSSETRPGAGGEDGSPDYTELVIVCCHATYVGTGGSLDEDQWILQPFQRSDPAVGKPSEHLTFVAHVLAGAQLCQGTPAALLMFSGGRTTASERTEAGSYYMVAERLAEAGAVPAAVLEHCAKEEWATDSYQNLLFSILRFRRLTGRYPENVTVVTHAFKERRLLELHGPAIKWPRAKLRVLGVNPPFTLDELEQTQRGEYERAYKLMAADPYGVRSPLADKREARNWRPSHVREVGVDGEDAITQLLLWSGGESGKDVFPGKLPWERL